MEEDIKIKDGSESALQSTKGRISALCKKLRGIKHIELIVSLVIIAVALLIYAGIKTAPQNVPQPTSAGTVSESMTLEETRLSAVLSKIEGAGRVTVMIAKSEEGRSTGVVIVADGAGNPKVKLKLVEAAEAALGLPGSAIEVYVSA
jgi:stage III sporulation protein AG